MQYVGFNIPHFIVKSRTLEGKLCQSGTSTENFRSISLLREGSEGNIED